MKYCASVPGYQIRYAGGGEPATLIASDVADAMRQARQPADRTGATVALWRNGALVAECAPSNEAARAKADAELIAQLVEAGVYVFTAPKA